MKRKLSTPPNPGSTRSLDPTSDPEFNGSTGRPPNGGSAALACPTESDPVSRVGGASCPIPLDAMMTRCSAVHFLSRVSRNFTDFFHPRHAQKPCRWLSHALNDP